MRRLIGHAAIAGFRFSHILDMTYEYVIITWFLHAFHGAFSYDIVKSMETR